MTDTARSPRTVHGTVCDAAGAPVAGARVQFVHAPGPVPDVAALTDADGRFALAAARAGVYELVCHADALGSVRAQVEVSARGDSPALRLTVRR